MNKSEKNINSYIEKKPKDIQKILTKIRLLIKNAAPMAIEDIKYGMPTFILNNKNLIHFASFEKHIGIYPTPSPIIKFKKELSKYETSKGAIQFPLDKKLPFGLITKIVKFRIKEIPQNSK